MESLSEQRLTGILTIVRSGPADQEWITHAQLGIYAISAAAYQLLNPDDQIEEFDQIRYLQSLLVLLTYLYILSQFPSFYTETS